LAIADPAERAQLASEILAEHQSLIVRLAQIRRQAIAELRASGLSYAQVGQRLGLTRARIAQLTPATVEREFFGGPAVTIAAPLRATSEGRPLVAQEDVEATMVLTRLLHAADLATELQHISPSGELDLSPDALVAICGPKSSPTVQQLIAGDPLFDFSADDTGRWKITDRDTGRAYSSPIDDDPAADRDLAYVARLRHPGRQHPILVIAGIHAIGSLGAANYLAVDANLRTLHHAAATGPFSMIIESRFVRSPLTTLSAHAVVEPRTHDL
jgi:hypothetical protein